MSMRAIKNGHMANSQLTSLQKLVHLSALLSSTDVLTAEERREVREAWRLEFDEAFDPPPKVAIDPTKLRAIDPELVKAFGSCELKAEMVDERTEEERARDARSENLAGPRRWTIEQHAQWCRYRAQEAENRGNVNRDNGQLEQAERLREIAKILEAGY